MRSTQLTRMPKLGQSLKLLKVPCTYARSKRICKSSSRFMVPQQRGYSTQVSTIPSLQLFQQLLFHAKDSKSSNVNHASIISKQGTFSYSQLLRDSFHLAKEISSKWALFQLYFLPIRDLMEDRIAVLCENGYDYVISQLAVWRAGGIFVPLCTTHPPAELEYVIDDSGSRVVICDAQYYPKIESIARKRNIRIIQIGDSYHSSSQPDVVDSPSVFNINPNRSAMIIYTSGTTGKPKGVVSNHLNIESQILSMIGPWGWSSKDHILHVLPLHHLHGVINVLNCSLWAGAVCEMFPKFHSHEVWNRFMRKDEKPDTLNLFMAVPTIYAKLIEDYEKMSESQRQFAKESCSKFRLMVSGSMALPESIMNKWKEISGHVLLERYGMTEIGMALSNPLHGERKAGYVGTPLPGVTVKIVDEIDQKTVCPLGKPGELLVKGPTVFTQYWNRKEATQSAFDQDGYFKTGDIAVCENGVYKILGRASVDIIKSGGYKISALDIERELLEHPNILECAVVGVEDVQYGQIVSAIVALRNPKEEINVDTLRTWCKDRIAGYQTPRMLLVVPSIPRNAMGKVNKKELVKLFLVS